MGHLDRSIEGARSVREYQPMTPELADRRPRTLLQLVHDTLTTGERVTLSLGISIEPLHPSHRESWSLADTATLLLALQVDMGAVPRPTFEQIHAAWTSRKD
jgi:hypothetical protein